MESKWLNQIFIYDLVFTLFSMGCTERYFIRILKQRIYTHLSIHLFFGSFSCLLLVCVCIAVFFWFCFCYLNDVPWNAIKVQKYTEKKKNNSNNKRLKKRENKNGKRNKTEYKCNDLSKWCAENIYRHIYHSMGAHTFKGKLANKQSLQVKATSATGEEEKTKTQEKNRRIIIIKVLTDRLN